MLNTMSAINQPPFTTRCREDYDLFQPDLPIRAVSKDVSIKARFSSHQIVSLARLVTRVAGVHVYLVAFYNYGKGFQQARPSYEAFFWRGI